MDRHGDQRFYALLEEIADLHSKKSHDYTPADDPLANFKRSERLGIPAWKGTLVRMGDKFGRLEQLAGGKVAQNESLRDTLIDLSVYSLLAILLLEDAQPKHSAKMADPVENPDFVQAGPNAWVKAR